MTNHDAARELGAHLSINTVGITGKKVIVWYFRPTLEQVEYAPFYWRGFPVKPIYEAEEMFCI